MRTVHLSSAEITSLRGPKNQLSPKSAYACLVEEELSASRELVRVATIFLTNRECPFRCLMCDLWKNTLDETIDPGLIPAQIRRSLDELGSAEHIKLYNSGNFFDRKAIPPEDHKEISRVCKPFERVIVESHPKLIGEPVIEFQRLLDSEFEVAMGLETIHPEVLPALNKSMTTNDFSRAAEFLRSNDIGIPYIRVAAASVPVRT